MNDGARGNTDGMPDRAIIPLMPAVSLGFICGLIASVLQMQTGAALTVAVAGAAVVVLAGVSSVFGSRGDAGEKAAVAVLRALTAVALFACLFLFMRTFLGGGGNILLALVWLVLGGAFGLLLARITVRDRRSKAERERDGEEVDDDERDDDRTRVDAEGEGGDRDGRIYRESDDFRGQNGNGPRERTTA